MTAISEPPAPATIQQEARALWSGQRLPPLQGPIGPPDGPIVRQFLGAFAPQEAGTLVAQRAVAADVDARALLLAGRRAQGILRKEDGGPPVEAPRLDPVLTALAIWVGGSDGQSWDGAPRHPEVQRVVGRLAHMGALAVRDVSLRICPACAMARSPERIVYQEEDGETLLVRFPFPDGDRTVSALVWTDAAWRLLGTSALMIHPDLLYVIARYHRKEVDELIFTSKSSLDRLRGWLPGAEIEVLEEHPGRHWEGRSYVHPLRHEFPMGGALEPPGGTIVPIPDVSDSGTGVVPLVPGHGGTDTQIADRLSVPGWPLVTPKGRFDILFVHKYAGLELESGSEFVVRDLDESGAVFARLRVRRGVPRCARCGTALIWAPGRAWCLEPSRLPAEKLALYRSLLPRERPIERLEAVPWPVSEPQRSDDSNAVALLECSSCDRLEAADQSGDRCVCGGRRRVVRRRLLAAFDGAVSAWASVDPFANADAVRLYVNERRRAPAVVHHIAAMSGVAGNVGEVRLSVLPTVPETDLLALVAAQGADAVRAALVRSQAPEGATATFPERCAQEARRLAAFVRAAAAIRSPIDGAALAGYGQPIGSQLGDLEPEDRAFLARLERVRIQALVDYDRSVPDLVHRRLFQFVENDLALYRVWVAPRLAAAGSPPGKRAAQHTLVHALFTLTQLLAPIAPHTAEAVHRSLRRSRASVFQELPVGVDRALLDPGRATAWDRWVTVVRAVDRFRRAQSLPPGRPVPNVALVVDSDVVGDEIRADAPTIERLAHVGKLEVGSPGAPWAGRRRQLRPRESEIQRVYSSRAAQIVHLLKRMPERKATDSTPGQGFSMIVNGQPTQILPSMFAWEETIPERFVPADWSGGELYAELPRDSPLPSTPAPPPLSPDALRLVARVRWRLRSVPSSTPRVVIVAASAAVASELAQAAVPIARHLGITEFRLVGSDGELPLPGRGYGRTKAGAAWSFHVSEPGPARRAAKHRPTRAHAGRMRPAFRPGDLSPTVQNFADPQWIEREAGIRALGEELSELLGTPLLGPSKVAAAWDAGLRDLAAFRKAPWSALVGLPGFGVPITSALVTKLGGTVPPRPPVGHRRRTFGPAGPVEPETPAPPSWSDAGTAPSSPVVSRPARAIAGDSPPDSALPTPVTQPPFLPPVVVSLPPPDMPESVEPGPPPAPSPPLREEVPTGSAPPDSNAPVELSPAGEPPSSPSDSLPASADDRPMEPSPSHDEAPLRVEALTSPADAGTEPSESSPVEPVEEEPRSAEIPVAVELPADAATPSSAPESGPAESPDATVGAPLSEAGSEEVPAERPPSSEEAPEPGIGAVSSPPVATLPPAEEGPVERLPSPEGAPGPDSVTDYAAPDVAVLTAEEAPEIPPPTPGPSESPSELPVPEGGATEQERPALETTPLVATEAAPNPELSPSIPESEPADRSPPPETAPEARPTPVPLAEPAGLAPLSPTAPEPSPSAEELSPPMSAEAAPPPAVPSVSESLGFPPLGAAPPLEVLPPPPAPEAGIDLLVGPTYIPSLERFLEATAAGHQGICVVRDSPERLRAYIGSRPVEIRWLTNIGRGPTLKPTDLDGFSAFLAHAVAAGHVTAFFLEGVEYLVRLHGLEDVIERMDAFDRLAREHAARVWMPLNPKLLSPAELDRFVATFGPGSGMV